MKKLFLTSLITIVCLATFGQQPFFYNAKTSSSQNKRATKLFITYEIAGIKYKDSLNVADKQPLIKKSLPQPVAATLYTNDRKIEPITVMLANNNLSITINDKNLAIDSDKIQEDFKYLTTNDRIRPNYFPLYGELSAKNDTAGLNKLGVIFDSLKSDDIKKSITYFKENKTSLLSLFAFNRYTTFFADYSKVDNDFTQLPAWAQSSPDGKIILAKIEGSKSAQINTLAKKFTQQTSNGKIVSLNEFSNKYVLLDFWASWCAPCRKEHPNLIKTYDQFKNKNFEIISISLDADKANWLNAIKQDKLTWTQISDLKGQQNDIAVQYGVQSVPANFLIDTKGVIIEKNIKPEDLSKKLALLLDK